MLPRYSPWLTVIGLVAIGTVMAASDDLSKLSSMLYQASDMSEVLEVVSRFASDLSVSDAAMIVDRIRDGKFRWEQQNDLLKALVTKMNPAVFLPLVAFDMLPITFDIDGTPIQDISSIKRALWLYKYPSSGIDQFRPFDLLAPPLPVFDPRLDVSSVPPVVVDAIDRITQSYPAWMRSEDDVWVTPDDIRAVRALYPSPFDRIFPFNQYVARRLVPVLKTLPKAELLCAVTALVPFGLRFDYLDVIELAAASGAASTTCSDLEALGPDLDGLLALAHPKRHLFHQVVTDDEQRDTFTPSVLDGAWIYQYGQLDGRPQHFAQRLDLMPILCKSEAFVLLLRRHQTQLAGAICSLNAERQRAFVLGLAASDASFLHSPPFRPLTNQLVDHFRQQLSLARHEDERNALHQVITQLGDEGCF